MVTPEFGGPELFEERDAERPEPDPDQVLVRVLAAGTNPVDAKLRAEGSFAGLESPVILGSDVSGVVEEAGVRELQTSRRATRFTTRRRSSAPAPTEPMPNTTSPPQI